MLGENQIIYWNCGDRASIVFAARNSSKFNGIDQTMFIIIIIPFSTIKSTLCFVLLNNLYLPIFIFLPPIDTTIFPNYVIFILNSSQFANKR